ncbi:MAG TPA: WXG100 family type VII secretion target, partial [Pseudonocardiaceae bacterium]
MYPGQSVRPAGGPDGHHLTQPVNGHLDYVSQLSRQLGVNDPVESYLTPVVGRWSDLHAEATRWRTAASTATQVTQALSQPLGGLDAAWQGPAADSFVDYMHSVGLAGNDLADAMNAMADALDKTADGLRQIVTEMIGMLADTAEQASDAMSVPVGGEDRARQ